MFLTSLLVFLIFQHYILIFIVFFDNLQLNKDLYLIHSLDKNKCNKFFLIVK